MNVSLEKINKQYFANANVYPQIPLKSSKRKRLTTQTKPDIRYLVLNQSYTRTHTYPSPPPHTHTQYPPTQSFLVKVAK